MLKKNTSRQKKASKNPLYAQILFTALAFLMMAILSFIFMSRIVKNSLAQNVENMMAFAQAKIETDLLEPKIILNGFAQSVRGMILRGDDVDTLRKYIYDLTEFLNVKGVRILRDIDLYFFYEMYPDKPVLMNNP